MAAPSLKTKRSFTAEVGPGLPHGEPEPLSPLGLHGNTLPSRQGWGERVGFCFTFKLLQQAFGYKENT